MKKLFCKKYLLIVGIAITLAGSPVFPETAGGVTPASPAPLALRKIMQDMGENMQSIVDAISREEWQRVEKNALQIADHPQPPLAEKIRILAFIVTDVSKFKSHDGNTHESARVLAESAAREDGYAVIADFATLQNTCLMCHQRFRKPFQKHFYDKSMLPR